MAARGTPYFVAALLATCASISAMSSPALATTSENTSTQELSPYTISIPAVIDDNVSGTVTAYISGMKLVGVEQSTWEDAAAGKFDTAIIETISSHAQDGVISVEAFQQQNVDVEFDVKTLQLIFDPDDEQRFIQDLSLRPVAVDYENISGHDLPSRSAYVNINFEQEYRWNDDFGQNQTPTQLSLDGVLQIAGNPRTVLEGGMLYDSEARDEKFTRSEIRLVHDDVKRAIRYSIGDIFYRSKEFQNAPPLLGLSVERAYDEIQPLRNISPTGERSFTVSQRSSVDVFVNGLFQKTLRLQPGRYQLSDFAINAGVNEVLLLITDSTGAQRQIDFSLFSDPGLLEKGLSEFSFNVGYLRNTDNFSQIDYDYSSAVASGFFRYGLTENLTLGVDYQGTDGLNNIGAETAVASPFGVFSAKYNSSDSDIHGSGEAASLTWSYDFFLGKKENRPHEIDVVAIQRTENYTVLGQTSAFSRYEEEYRARYTAPGPFDTFLNLSARHAKPFEQFGPVEEAYTIDVSKRFGRLNTSLRLGHETFEGEDETRLVVRLSVPFGKRQRFDAQWDSLDQSSRAVLSRYSSDVVGDISGSLGLRSEADTLRGDVELFYQGNRFVANADHAYTDFTNTNTPARQVSRFALGSSIAYADGAIGVGRPITDSFIMVQRHPTLKDTKVRVDERLNGYTAIADDFGPAIVPSVNSYISRDVSWDAENPPAGYDLGDIEAKAFPLYRSGIAYMAGSAASITAMGIALDQTGMAIALSAARVYPADDPEGETVLTFTNRNGRFVIQGLAPGDYRIEFANRTSTSFNFSVESDAVGTVQLGTLREVGEQ